MFPSKPPQSLVVPWPPIQLPTLCSTSSVRQAQSPPPLPRDRLVFRPRLQVAGLRFHQPPGTESFHTLLTDLTFLLVFKTCFIWCRPSIYSFRRTVFRISSSRVGAYFFHQL